MSTYFSAHFFISKIRASINAPKIELVNCPKITDSSLTSSPATLPENRHFKIIVLFFKLGFSCVYINFGSERAQLVVNMGYLSQQGIRTNTWNQFNPFRTVVVSPRDTRCDTRSWTSDRNTFELELMHFYF